MSARRVTVKPPTYAPGSEYLGGTFAQMLPQAALPGKVAGIISLDPPTVQCDGCGLTYAHPKLSLAVCVSGIEFNPKAYTSDFERDRRRLCRPCAREAGWQTEAYP